MQYLFLSILASTIIFVVFKMFDRFKINILHAIVVNYFIACFSGIIAYEETISVSEIVTLDWFYYTLGLGALFIVVFNLMALTTQRSGLSVVSVATKMSLVIPIIFGLLYYKESLGIFKGVGIALAIIAVYLASIKSKKGIAISPKNLLLPALVFLGSGIIDTSLQFLQDTFVAPNEVPIFSATIFAAAAIIGILILCIHAIQGKFKFEWKNVIGGIILGIPNYFSVYFLVKTLSSGLLDSSGIFTINNVAIVLLSTLVGILLFREKLIVKNWIGIMLAVLSILSIFLAAKYGF